MMNLLISVLTAIVLSAPAILPHPLQLVKGKVVFVRIHADRCTHLASVRESAREDGHVQTIWTRSCPTSVAVLQGDRVIPFDTFSSSNSWIGEVGDSVVCQIDSVTQYLQNIEFIGRNGIDKRYLK